MLSFNYVVRIATTFCLNYSMNTGTFQRFIDKIITKGELEH